MNLDPGLWRSEMDFVVPHPDFDSVDDIRIMTARQVWERVVEDPAVYRFASLDPDGPEGLVFDCVLADVSPGQVVDATVEAALRSLDMAGLDVVGGAPVEIRLTAFAERPSVLPGELDQP